MSTARFAAILVLALASASAAQANTGGGHTGGGHGCAGHPMGPPGHHCGGVAVRGCGGSYYDATYRERSSAIDRELHDRAVKTQHAKEEFATAHPCPATGATTGSCPGYVIECIAPDPADPSRCFDGANLQWRAVTPQGVN